MQVAKKLQLAVLVLVLSASNVFALTWQEALKVAEKNNHELISAQKQVEASEWSYRKAMSVFLPNLSAQASIGEATARASSYGLSVTQTLFDGTQNIYGLKSAYADLESEKASLAATRASVYYDLRSAFITLVIKQEQLKLYEQLLDQREENSGLVQLRYESGKEDKGNLMTTQADEKQAEYDLASAKRDLKLAKLKLSQLLKREVDVVEAAGELKEIKAADFAGLVKTAPDYIIARKQLESYELAQKESLSGFLPSLSLSGSYRKTGTDWPPDVSSSKSWSLSLSYPLFNGGSNIADRVIANVQLDQAKEDFAKTVDDFRYSLERAFQDHQDALESLDVSKVSLAAGKERAKITEAKYLNGLTTYDEWYRIENTFFQTQKNLLTSKQSAYLAEAAWHKTYGGYIQ
ncbi:hypothetical protein A3F86_04265 [candidate division WOR-1 bacterium RIFCSPLOWO2_12_FULL_45_9]|uniref:Transporter n=1 Tax=candidate division WOR-1 bacterium RIFCSPLOWO2_12_FULL_45_9 TaxID=1802568 RepID=A0A1F4RRU1_UNCSA|nr:MAG: hypothetical protein A3F86_04265 [candidate division WOR-1 bacterium RIFCSPLOWO2_12_FULL_45_9]